MIVNNADDATLKVTSNSREANQEKLIQGLDTIEKYLTSNKLSINRAKTAIQEVMIGQKRARTKGNPPQLRETENGKITIIKAEKITQNVGNYTPG